MPDARGDSQIFAFAEPQRVTDKPERGQADPGREFRQSFPRLRPESFERSQCHTKHERIKPDPGWIVDPCLKTAKGNAGIGEVVICEKCAERDPADNDHGWNDNGSPQSAIHKKQQERQREIELVFDCQRPRVRESGAAVKRDVWIDNRNFQSGCDISGYSRQDGSKSISRARQNTPARSEMRDEQRIDRD